MLCRFCGYILRENAAVCDRCGRAVTETPSTMAGTPAAPPEPPATPPSAAPAAPSGSLGPLWSSPGAGSSAGAPESASAPEGSESPAEANPLVYTPAPTPPPAATPAPSPAPFASQAVPAFAAAGSGLFGQPVPAAVPQVHVRYAGFWRRFLAFVLDFFIVISAVYALFEKAGIFPPPPATPEFGTFPMSARIMLLLYLVYCVAMEASPVQATLGKRALELAVTDKDGDRLSIARAIGRNLGKALSGIILYIGFIMAGFTAKKQALHDMLGGCLVIRRPN